MSKRKILLKRNNQVLSDGKPKLPMPDQIDNGEIVMNYATGVETLAIKNSNDEIVTFTNEVKIGNETPSNGSMAKLFINENDSSLQYHANDGWRSIDIGEGGEPVNIVQTTGTATDAVMSQNAVTNELNKKANVSHTHQSSQITGLSTVATSGSYDDLINKPTIPEQITVDSDLSSTSINPVQNRVINSALANKANTSDVYSKTEANSTFATKTELADSEYELPIASTTQLGGVRVGDGLEIDGSGILNCTIDPGSGTVSWGNIQGKPAFATVATSGSYNDLSDKPSIPSPYTLPTASSSTLGGVKSSTTGTTPDRDYMIQVNTDGTMKVNVPWINTTYSNATTATDGLMSSTDKQNLTNIVGKSVVVSLGDLEVTYDDTSASISQTGTTLSLGGTETLESPTFVLGAIAAATTTTAGLMTAADKTKLNTLETNPQGTVDNPYIIQPGDDINDCVSLGWYISNGVEDILNRPSTIDLFSMLVIPSSAGPNQIAFTYEGKICVRYNGDVWHELYTEPITDEEITQLLLT